MARFVVVLPLVPLAAGAEFTVAEWPLHVTLIEPFSTELPASAVATVIGRIAHQADTVHASGGEEAMFGRRRDVPVTLVRDGGELEALRSRALDALREEGVDFGHVREEYRPHVSRKQDRRLRWGERVELGTIALIDMRPSAGSHHRNVIATWQLGAAASVAPD
ncbi:2'-5' RNA ligase family protein [Agromyces sp. ISL-38]|uniref:2'-5' RNA ligase family protein n=1 Tax=Agromyces sp. ISL-38 TaxID=2819107 RepID=UPI001BEB0968|nr:2'-5' RNA ligase family protein [Agromyces sp. ISL-38]MBT2500387.1 2'-5' RNA ligase family protein [Agromyces sp. ISL-38]